MAFRWKDNVIYDELWNEIPATAVTVGQAAVVQDTFGFYVKAREAAGEEIAFIYRCRQVEADKLTGTGEAIVHGDRVYAVVAQNFFVTANPVGVAGVDYYYCGTAKKDAAASAEKVLIRFDGTRYDENI